MLTLCYMPNTSSVLHFIEFVFCIKFVLALKFYLVRGDFQPAVHYLQR